MRGAAEEIPVALGSVRHFHTHSGKCVRNFRREQVAMLVADVVRRAFQVDVNPASTFEPIRFCQNRVAGVALTERHRPTRVCASGLGTQKARRGNQRNPQHE